MDCFGVEFFLRFVTASEYFRVAESFSRNLDVFARFSFEKSIVLSTMRMQRHPRCKKRASENIIKDKQRFIKKRIGRLTTREVKEHNDSSAFLFDLARFNKGT
ncbi:PREDICTED: uncharacterized protein LOC105151981 [Acromyrmex echinatior]|uniref:uncharacterized protein LOC105151981 n=1 Tax=Acromyrmex echinatior TaxID=103372 RepID=UPI000580EF42|nr:PREDICTED: uncharacterized protein LOC105151981 [Acromyrmex echinatior]